MIYKERDKAGYQKAWKRNAFMKVILDFSALVKQALY